MAVYNTPFDAANTAVRSFLTSVGEHYWGRKFTTASGPGKAAWQQICDDFSGACAYCETTDGPLQIEHLVMFNRTEYGLHHPGNIVPVCKGCNKRCKDESMCFVGWRDHLARVCAGLPQAILVARLTRIEAHIVKFNYPDLSPQERHAIRVIAESLYENVKTEVVKSLALYEKLDEAFVVRTE
jgi:hypothetical protein